MTQFHLSVPDPGVNGGGGFEIGSFDFHGKPVVILSNDAGNWAVLGQLCRNLTLDTEAQRQALARKSWSQGRTCITQVQLPGDSQRRPQFLIHERVVPMWLANIASSRIEDPTIRTNIEQAQVELADALHEYVSHHGKRRNAELGPLAIEEVRHTALARAREMVDYRTFRDMMSENATDYEPSSKATGLHFATMQNKLYLHLTGMTAEQIKKSRPLAVWPGREEGKPEPSAKNAARKVAKNYLMAGELSKLNRLVGRLCLRADDITDDNLHLSLAQWDRVVDMELATTLGQIAA